MHSGCVPRATHPLLSPFPVAVMLLALLLVVFAFAMAALNSDTDADLALGPSAHVPQQGQVHVTGGRT